MGGVASFQFQVGPAFSMPTLAPVLSGSLSSSGALTLRWPAVATGQTTEVQQVNASGQQVSLFAGGVSVVGGTGTEEPDAQGVYCLLASGTSCVLQLPAGFTGAFRARTIGGGVAIAPAGPWSNVVAESIPAGTPNIVLSVSGVSFGTPGTTYVDGVTPVPTVPVTFTLTAKNTGTAAGRLSAMWAITVPQWGSVSNDVVAANDAWYGGVIVPAGGQVSLTVSTGNEEVPILSAPQPFTIHVALAVQENTSQPFYTYQGSPQDYVYQLGKSLQAIPGDRAFSFSYGG